MLPNDHLIPLDILHRVLPIFGINSPTRAYDRWVRPDGLLVRDFDEVIGDSRFVFTIDWRSPMDEAMEPIVAAVQTLGIELHFEVTDEENGSGVISRNGQRLPAVYEPDDPHRGFSRAIAATQQLAGAEIEFRQSPDNEHADTCVYAVLRRDEWRQLDVIAPQLIQTFFVECAPKQQPPEVA